MEKVLKEVLPIMTIEHDCILSKQGDITVAYQLELPEIFSLSDQEYEAFHHAWIKAIKLLPKYSVLHKQDWFIDSRYECKTAGDEQSFLSKSSDRFFKGRPFLGHQCYVFITKKANGRKQASSMFSNLIGSKLVPEQTISSPLLQDFLDSCGQFRQVIEDSGMVKLTRLIEADLYSNKNKVGLIERYCTLSDHPQDVQLKDIQFNGDGIQIGDRYSQLYTLGDVEDLPGLCGSRINYDRYSTDRTKFSIGFAATLGQLLNCSHIYNQYLFIDDTQQAIKELERKRLRLQSLSAYSRENTIARDATNDFLNEAIAEQRLPVKAHFNILLWSDDKKELKDLKNKVSSALAQMDAAAKLETSGAPQIFWAGIPGNAADFPMNDTFDTFAEQASCFLNLETGYQSSTSPMGIRLGDRLTGLPVRVDISDEFMEKGVTTNRNKFVLGPSGACRAIFN